MKINTKVHLLHYLVLLIIMFAGLFSFIYFPLNYSIRMVLVGLLSLAYFLWGIIHHKLENSLYPEVIAEYLIICVLGTSLVAALLYYL
ncbi:hypothetical protein HY333_02005 [Candidatus Collierbacteria bacterium]|nr:hypothetical protein [Candidatus Collierbacteria bacterium]